MPSVTQKLHNRYHALDTVIKAGEGWGKTAMAHKATFKQLVAAQSKFELALKKHFRDLAKNRVNNFVNWNQYKIDLIKAYDYVVDPDNYDYTDEQDFLRQILVDYITLSMGIGVDFANQTYVPSGLSPTSESVQKAALTRSAKLVTQITDSTRARIQQSVATSFKLGENVQEAQARLEAIIDDPYRAEMIARTETRNSYVDGAGQVADATGATSKVWDPSSDPCPLCQENVDDGEIDINDDFTNGDDPHINCLCGSPIFHYPADDSSSSSDGGD